MQLTFSVGGIKSNIVAFVLPHSIKSYTLLLGRGWMWRSKIIGLYGKGSVLVTRPRHREVRYGPDILPASQRDKASSPRNLYKWARVDEPSGDEYTEELS